MPDPAPTTPRRFRFGLRSLFVLVAVVAMGCAWVDYAKHWIQLRHEVLKGNVRQNMTMSGRPRAPGFLWLLGEKGVAYLFLPSSASNEELEMATRNFPKAHLVARVEPGEDW